MLLNDKSRDSVPASIVSITTLHSDGPYPDVGVRHKNTKYGMRIVAALSEGHHANVVEVFLPKHYGDIIEDSDVEALNTKQTQYYLTYRGTSPSSKAIILQFDM
jgi:hypothetical protein